MRIRFSYLVWAIVGCAGTAMILFMAHWATLDRLKVESHSADSTIAIGAGIELAEYFYKRGNEAAAIH